MSKCEQCNLALIIKDHMNALIQLLTHDLGSYRMDFETTKCLNTTVAIMFFLIGEKGIKISEACDCTSFNEKSKKYIEQSGDTTQNSRNVLKLYKQVIEKPRKKNSRDLFYVLLTDNYFSFDNKPDTVYFPGHVFIIEKTANYHLYQSYIQQYDLGGYFSKNNNHFDMSHSEMDLFIQKLIYIMNAAKWDETCVQYWMDMTFVDTTKFLGAISKNNFFICFQKVPMKTCLGNMKKYIKIKLSQIKERSQTFDGPIPQDKLIGELNTILEKIQPESLVCQK